MQAIVRQPTPPARLISTWDWGGVGRHTGDPQLGKQSLDLSSELRFVGIHRELMTAAAR
jgi:hypothetical protein